MEEINHFQLMFLEALCCVIMSIHFQRHKNHATLVLLNCSFAEILGIYWDRSHQTMKSPKIEISRN